jgi:hypothetical protein
MKIDPTQIQNLLRERRNPSPPTEDYFEDFLRDFQRRQRSEMLRRPVWEILWDRTNAWLDGFRVPAVAYASIVAVAVGVTGVMLSGQDPAAPAAQLTAQSLSTPAPTSVPVATVSTGNDLPPSYVLESRPVANDRPFSF